MFLLADVLADENAVAKILKIFLRSFFERTVGPKVSLLPLFSSVDFLWCSLFRTLPVFCGLGRLAFLILFRFRCCGRVRFLSGFSSVCTYNPFLLQRWLVRTTFLPLKQRTFLTFLL